MLLSGFGVPGIWRRLSVVAGAAVSSALVVTLVPGPAEAATSPAEGSTPEVSTSGAAPLTAPDAVSARITARLENQPVEVLGQRTETTSVFVLPDGTMAAAQGSGPVWVRQGDGDGTAAEDWAPVDLTLAVDDDGTVRPVAHPGSLEISGGSTGGTGPTDLVSITDAETDTVTRVQWDSALPTPTLAGRRATYEDVQPGVDLVVEATATGAEEFFVLESAPAPGAEPVLPLRVVTEGAAVETTEDGGLVVREGDDVIASAAAPTMWDASADQARPSPITEPRPAEDANAPRLSPMPAWVLSGEHQPEAESDATARADAADVAPEEAVDPMEVAPTGAVVEVEQDVRLSGSDSAEVTLKPQEEFLQAPDTQYPVVVDPDVNLNWGFDTHVMSGYNDDRSARTDLVIGRYGSNVARSFIQFDTSGLVGASVTAARLELWNFHSSSCTPSGWEVWDTTPASPASTWANQPAWLKGAPRATSNATRGYSSSCAGGWVNIDVTHVARDWAAGTAPTGTIGIKATDEASNGGWKRFYASENGAYIPSIWVTYNHTPAAPSSLTISPSGTVRDSVRYIAAKRPTLSAVLRDPDGGSLTGRFEIWDGSTLVDSGQVPGVPSGFVASWAVTKDLQEGKQYTLGVSATDGTAQTAWINWYPLRIDLQAPGAPTVGSLEYPDNGTWNQDQGVAATFTLTPPPTPDPSLVEFRWALNKTPDPAQVVKANGTQPVTFPVTPTTVGRQELQVQAVDQAGNTSAIVRYVFNVGKAGIVAPDNGTEVVRQTRLYVTARPEFTRVRFEWRHGNDALTVTAVPAGLLKTSDGRPWSSVAPGGWAPLPRPSDPNATVDQWLQDRESNAYTTWDVTGTVGRQGGPVDVRPVVSNADGSKTATGAWTSLIANADASFAASEEVGPGSVNLLTGDYTLSATDASMFGLTAARTASSRDPQSGYELQQERLTQAQQDGSATAGNGMDMANGGAVLTTSTTRWRSGPSGKSFKINPASTGSNNNTFASFNSDVGHVDPALVPGRRYRVTGWVYAAYLNAAGTYTDRRLRIVAFTRRPGDTAYTVTTSNMPTVPNAWQQLSVDFTVPPNANQAFIRLYNGFPQGLNAAQYNVFYDDISVREITAPFGPQWNLGTVDYNSATAYTKITQPESTVAAVNLTGGGEIWFTAGSNGVWRPQPGAQDLTLTKDGDTWLLRELDGTETQFSRRDNTTDAVVTRTVTAGNNGTARYLYEVPATGQSRLKRMVAPVQDGVDPGAPANAACADLSRDPVRGCQALELVYGTTTTATGVASDAQFGDFTGQVREILAWAWDPGAAAMAKVSVAQYRYDSLGRLRTVTDPRLPAASTGKSPVTSYEYDAAGRVTVLTPPGDRAAGYTFTYGAVSPLTGAGDLIDASPGRLFAVSRGALDEGGSWSSTPNVERVVYNAPLSRGAGGPYDMTPADLATWAQQDGPTDATAVFGPEDDPGISVATSAAPGRDGYRPATVHYLNASGKEVNTAEPAGPGTPAAGFIDTNEYDRFGNVIRSLDATNRLLALSTTAADQAVFAAWNLPSGTTASDSAARALMLDSRKRYSADGLNVVTEVGPAQRLAVGNNADDPRTMRVVTENTYDEGKPDGAPYRLVTTSTTYGLELGTNPPAKFDTTVTKTAYDPIDGARPLGDTSGWVHRHPTVVTEDAGDGGARLTTATLYDVKGRTVRTMPPGTAQLNGVSSAPTATETSYYTAGANAADPDCGGHPEWAGLLCKTRASGSVEGSTSTLPDKWVAAYSYYGSPAVVRERVLTGGAVSSERTTTTGYDGAGRVTTAAVVGTADLGRPLSTVTTTYNRDNGQVARVTDGATAIAKTYDALGRLATYTDADGATTTTSYNRFDKPIRIVTPEGTQTVTYDAALDPRRLPSAMTDSVGGTIRGVWGPDGQLQRELLPGGILLEITYDPARVPTARTYWQLDAATVSSISSSPDLLRTATVDGTNATRIVADSVIENNRGQWLRHTDETGVRDYTYDRAGRLTDVKDANSALQTCTWRAYDFDARGNRTALSSTTAQGTEAPPACALDPRSAGSDADVTTYTSNSADQLTATTGPGGSGWQYDAFGRTTTFPDANGAAVHNTFFTNDLIAGQEQDGVGSATWALDPTLRRRVYTSTPENGTATSTTSHYTDDSDNPDWFTTAGPAGASVTRYVTGLTSELVMSTGTTAAANRVVMLTDLHGDVTTTIALDDQGARILGGVRSASYEEYGTPRPLAAGTSQVAGRYGWLGAQQRSTEALGGVTLMGVRLYLPYAGRFLSTDPVPGGNSTAYAYPQDPVNMFDLDGRWPNWGKVWNKVKSAASSAAHAVGNAARRAGRWVYENRRAITHFVVGAAVTALTWAAAGAMCVGVPGAGCLVAASIVAGMPTSLVSHLVVDRAYGHRTTGREALGYLVSGGIRAPGVNALVRYRYYGMGALGWARQLLRGGARGI